MHLLASQPGGFTDEAGIIDLEQTSADIVILSAADSSLAALADAAESLPDHFPSIRLANWMNLLKPAAYDLYEDKVLCGAKVVVVSLLGGVNYWQYGYERMIAWAQENSGCTLIMVPGDDAEDDDVFAASNVDRDSVIRVWRFLREGGAVNNQQLFRYLADEYLGNPYIGKKGYGWHEPEALPRCMMYLPDSPLKHSQATYSDWLARWASASNNKAKHKANTHVVIVLFYRSHLQSANTSMFDGLIGILEEAGLQPLPIAIASLKDAESVVLVNALIEQANAQLIINTTGFSSNVVDAPDLSSTPTAYRSPIVKKIPVIQVVLSSSTQDDWDNYKQGLRSRDIAMQVSLPEMDGRIISRAICFKSNAYYSERCQISTVRYVLLAERARFVAELAKKTMALTHVPNKDKRIALILANYPTKDGRIGNGVGLDTPQSTLHILQGLARDGYSVNDIPQNGTALIKELLGAVTNNPNTVHFQPCWQSISMTDYREAFNQLPEVCRQAVIERWGQPEDDPKCRQNRIMLSGIRLGTVFVGIQPARGFNVDLLANYHDPDLIPPHNYLAFYFWMRHVYRIDAIVHVGKHGNLEWLPGKGVALSEQCWPDIALGPMPHFYPFIVNDPGEGSQAKRRAQAVIIDHLMPPMTRAEVYGELAELENLVDEYYQALGLDTRRETWLREKILEQVKSTHVLQELACQQNAEENDILTELDTYLCDIKEAQIRHGLHILGELPIRHKVCDTLVALMRLPRGTDNASMGLLHAMAEDMQLMQGDMPFDPLDMNGDAWLGNKPAVLAKTTASLWRTVGDTRERLELLAHAWIEQYVLNDAADITAYVTTDKTTHDFAMSYPLTHQQLVFAKTVLLKALEKSVDREVNALLEGLRGMFIEPGPSGAPTRGRLDTLPTGRNFYSVDNRSIPSQAAWALGQKSATALIERHLQEHGDYPKKIGLSVWGTATMRTGGDDIAQAFALMGVKPVWAQGSQRIVDVEVVPAMLMSHPRVDVTLRISGFFRDAFPNVMQLYDTAIQALMAYDEPGGLNTIQTHIQQRIQTLVAEGLDQKTAERQASFRVFGSKPGAYGAGLQGLIDERCWETSSDLAEAYLNWGGYAYGNMVGDGVDAKAAFKHQLSTLEAVVQNQDNREHDILDSDDYYQFQGGMTNAVTVFSGHTPAVYHNDHSNPEAPKVRTLKEELNRVIRSRVLNPKWINAMREHGYKGAFEMAASVDYVFAYDATTNLVDDYQYEKIANALVFDPDNKKFMEDNNPDALEELTERLLEATQRGLWKDPDDHYANKLQSSLLDMHEKNEGK